jgi:hypothetical protein
VIHPAYKVNMHEPFRALHQVLVTEMQTKLIFLPLDQSYSRSSQVYEQK